jgi:hypothetical protein
MGVRKRAFFAQTYAPVCLPKVGSVASRMMACAALVIANAKPSQQPGEWTSKAWFTAEPGDIQARIQVIDGDRRTFELSGQSEGEHDVRLPSRSRRAAPLPDGGHFLHSQQNAQL